MPIFERQSQSGELLISFEATDLVMAGWTGRDAAAVQHHIEELEALGVPRHLCSIGSIQHCSQAPSTKSPWWAKRAPAKLKR